MTRQETTKKLGEILVSTKLSGIGKYYAKEVSFDYGTTDVTRIDFLQFCPVTQMGVSDLEKGYFVAYEIKSCLADYNSGYGKNFICEKNYIVTTMETYKKIVQDLPYSVGCLVAVPKWIDLRRTEDVYKEMQNPTPFSSDIEWKFYEAVQPRQQIRKRSMVEMLFCMLRSGKKEENK